MTISYVIELEYECDNVKFNNKLKNKNKWRGSGWYRIMRGAGSKLSNTNTVPSMGWCKTKKPGWLNGDHPENIGDTVTREFCFNDETHKVPLNVFKLLLDQVPFS